jgi:glycerol uptake facilitator protein
MQDNWFGKYIGEFLGVFFIILWGDGILHPGALHGAISGLFQGSIGWGFAVALAVWFGVIMGGGAHYNPSVTISLAVKRGFPWAHVLPYIIFQILGGFVAAAALGVTYSSDIANWLVANNCVIGDPCSINLAWMYSPYVPHPGFFPALGAAPDIAGMEAAAAAAMPWPLGFLAEFICGATLMGFIFVLLDERQPFKTASSMFPFALGIYITMAVFVFAPVSMTSINAARDLGPRLWLMINGYGYIAFPGLQGGMSLLDTCVAPILGGVVGTVVYDMLLGMSALPKPD